MRGILVALLLIVGGVAAMLANVGQWVDYTIYDTDGFVSTVDDVFSDEDVQRVVAERLSADIVAAAGTEERLSEELPERLTFLAGPLSRAIDEAIQRATLEAVNAQPFREVRNAALTEMHTLLIAIIEEDSEVLAASGDQLVLDLRPLLVGVAERVTGEEVSQQPGQGRLDIPEDAGKFVIDDSSVAWAYDIARTVKGLIALVTGIAVASFLLAIAIARDRRATLRTSGIILAAVGALSLLLVLLMRGVVERMTGDGEAAVSVVTILTNAYRAQSVSLVGFGVILVAVAALLGDSPFAVSARGWVRRSPEAPSLVMLIRQRVTVLRLTGLSVAAIALIAWPDPSTRVVATVLALLALYLLTLWLLASESAWAVSLRAHAAAFWEGATAGARERAQTERSPVMRLLVEHASWLRIAGIVVAVLVLVAWPSPGVGVFVAVVALTLLYLALIDAIMGRDSA
jgi:hypothetical protein